MLLRNNRIPLHQSSNFARSPSNHPGSGTMFFGNPAWTFSLTVAAIGAGATDISVSVCSYSLVSFEASFVICKDPSLSDSASRSFVCLELVLFVLRSYVLHVFRSSTDNAVLFRS